MIREQRLDPIQDNEATDAQAELLDRLRRPDGSVLNLFRTMANHPDLARRWLVFGNHILAKSTLSPRVRELAILRVGWLCQSEYEWGQHVLISLDLGITASEIKRLQDETVAAEWAPGEAAVLHATDELHADKVISAATWSALTEHYSEQQLMDLVFTVGQYTLVSMALNTFGVQRDEGVPGFNP